MPSGFTLAFKPALFNTPDFFSLQAESGWLSFYVLDVEGARAVAVMYVHLEDGHARTPLRAPFGSVESSGEMNPRTLFDFITYVEDQLKRRGASDFSIKNPPRGYDPEFISLLETFLLNRKYVLSSAEAGAVVAVTDTPFMKVIRHSEALRLRQARNAGFEFVLLPEDRLEAVYHFIAACHQVKGYSMSIALGDLRKTIDKFPDRYVLSAVMDQEHMRAAAVSIRVTDHILYNFMVNHEKRFNALSPPIMLMEGLYGYCQANQITLFDLGTSALDGDPNFSLLAFKLHMGAAPTTKFSFYKHLA